MNYYRRPAKPHTFPSAGSAIHFLLYGHRENDRLLDASRMLLLEDREGLITRLYDENYDEPVLQVVYIHSATLINISNTGFLAPRHLKFLMIDPPKSFTVVELLTPEES